MYYFFPLEPEFPVLLELVLGGLLPLPFPDLFTVALGAFFRPLDFAIILSFNINNGSNILGFI
ncbi:hypothetical protein ULMA_17120 [Patiriisocius marinus]|uniref:Uncharacterized protein n=1 Tax=Patiriisocius marinus TaxID=1397112 RepID=A0A5J4IXB3_9FLAO|nr:hypothetical protein ULMA_17120 [Patiriisocius marinus]